MIVTIVARIHFQ